MSIVTVEDLVKQFGEVTAVENASFEIADGEFVSILGPSGSGKSTILRMIAGFEEPTSGVVTIDGENVVGVPPFNRDVNMVFQNLALFPHLTVGENIQYGLKQAGVPKTERKERVEEMLSVVDLEGYADRKPDELSGGEQQRVALARAIVNKPKIVLFDEPLASLDRKLRQHMQVELQRIQAETGITFLYVTHDQEVAVAVSDRMVLLNDGEIEQIGTPADMYDRPVSKFVADFIGDVNTFSGQVQELTDTAVTVDLLGSTVELELSETIGSDLSPTDAVHVCLRPNNLSVVNGETTDDVAGVSGTVANRIYHGDGVTFIVDTEVGRLTVEDDAPYDIGDDVLVTGSWADAYVFPEED